VREKATPIRFEFHASSYALRFANRPAAGSGGGKLYVMPV
jgi:hypothetical protein